ncbi:MAG: superoxide dismutase family protein [Gemmatimonadetes bacterium]|nr:superoxide dismutase family protein [Gemmatimonadota bacterium]
MRAVPFAFVSLVSLVSLAACTPAAMSSGDPSTMRGGAGSASALVRDAGGRQLGTLTVAEMPGGLHTTGTLSGLPAGTHGIHLHAVGRCEPPFTTAGPHWNPTTRLHGFENPQGHHLGDMPNIVARADGSATVDVMTRGGTLRGAAAAMDADGLSVVVHASPDDYRTDPSGSSGARIACGEVRAAMP